MADTDRKMDTGQHLSLREYVALILVPLEREVSNLRSGVEKLSGSQANVHEIDTLKFQVASLSEALQELEKRLDTLERHDSVSTWIFRAVVGIGTALLIGWLSSLLR
jgi:hypothetical protein